MNWNLIQILLKVFTFISRIQHISRHTYSCEWVCDSLKMKSQCDISWNNNFLQYMYIFISCSSLKYALTYSVTHNYGVNGTSNPSWRRNSWHFQYSQGAPLINIWFLIFLKIYCGWISAPTRALCSFSTC